MPFEFEKLSIPEVILIKPKIFADSRGFFLEVYKKNEFSRFGINEDFVQDNHSYSKKNVLRGLHFQSGSKSQGKLIKCIKGRIWDVAVDIRTKSKSFKKWISVELTGENGYMLYIPRGFAHGFLVLSEYADVFYKCTEEYSPEHEGGIIWNDPDLAINWPVEKPLTSSKDAKLPLLKDILFLL